jgi:hypothetical protein
MLLYAMPLRSKASVCLKVKPPHRIRTSLQRRGAAALHVCFTIIRAQPHANDAHCFSRTSRSKLESNTMRQRGFAVQATNHKIYERTRFATLSMLGL